MDINAAKISGIDTSALRESANGKASASSVSANTNQEEQDAVKVSLSANGDPASKPVDEDGQKMQESARKILRNKSVQFLGSDGEGAATEIRFRIIEKDSGEVILEYPPEEAKITPSN